MMKKKMKLWCLLLSLVMILSVLPVAAFAVDKEAHYASMEEIIDDYDIPEVSMKVVNTKSDAEDWLYSKWLPGLRRALKADLDALGISTSSVRIDLDDFDAAIPKNRYDEDGTYGSAIVQVYARGIELGYTTLLIEADAWGRPPVETDDDDDDDDDFVTFGKSGLEVKILWEGDTSKDRPDSVLVEVYNNNKLFRTASLTGYKWTEIWKGVSGKGWSVDVRSVPDGYTCDIEKVSNTYFEITMTKSSSSSTSSNNTVSKPVVDKENPNTGAINPYYACR